MASETSSNVNSPKSLTTTTTMSSCGQSQTPVFATPDSGSDPGGSALLWLGVITCISILTAINMGGSNIFNP